MAEKWKCNCGFNGKLAHRCDKCFQCDVPLKIIREISRITIQDARKKVNGWCFVDLIVKCPICNEQYNKRTAFYPHLICNNLKRN